MHYKGHGWIGKQVGQKEGPVEHDVISFGICQRFGTDVSAVATCAFPRHQVKWLVASDKVDHSHSIILGTRSGEKV